MAETAAWWRGVTPDMLANIPGKLTASTAPSGVTTSGLYGAMTPVGLALSASEIHVEIGSPVTLT